MDVRVVTVAYNPGDEICSMVDSLEAALDGIEADVVVVNNGNETPALAELAQRGIDIRSAGGNVGYGAGVNCGAAGFSGTWIAVVNPDIEFRPHALAALLEAGRAHPHAAILGPRIETPGGELYPSARAFPRLTTGVGHALFGTIWPNNPWTKRYHAGHGETPDWLSGACLLIRRTFFEDIGGFDPAFFMFFEDTMLGEQAARHGWEVRYVPQAVVVHDKSASWRDRPESMLRAHHASAYTYLARVYDKSWQAPLRAALKVGLGVRLHCQLAVLRRHAARDTQ